MTSQQLKADDTIANMTNSAFPPLSAPLPSIDLGPFKFSNSIRGGADALPKVQFPNWEKWLRHIYPQYVSAGFAPRHRELWDWVDAIEKETRPIPFIAIWPRGGAKSTTAELAVVRMAFKKSRKYCWYISGTQNKADLHVASIASMLESPRLEHIFPELSSRLFGKFGNVKGWRRNRLRTASGMTVDALGLDVGIRGGKIDEVRPDLIILDDVDDLHDSLIAVAKKIETLTKTILPSGSTNCAILFVQNLIHQDSVATQLATSRADFLTERILSGPFKAVDNLVVENVKGRYRILSGTATWEGQDIATCQAQIQNWGLSAFKAESQHEVNHMGGIWDKVVFQHLKREELPDFDDVIVFLDPAVTSTDRSDSQGLAAAGVTSTGEIVFLYGWEGITSPEEVVEKAIVLAFNIGASHVGIETDQGGDTWKVVFDAAMEVVLKNYPKFKNKTRPEFTSDKAGAGHGSKIARNALMLSDYERGNVYHLDTYASALEASLHRFPKKPLDLGDAMYWCWQYLYSGEAAEWGETGFEGYRG